MLPALERHNGLRPRSVGIFFTAPGIKACVAVSLDLSDLTAGDFKACFSDSDTQCLFFYFRRDAFDQKATMRQLSGICIRAWKNFPRWDFLSTTRSVYCVDFVSLRRFAPLTVLFFALLVEALAWRYECVTYLRCVVWDVICCELFCDIL